jgi:ABC-type sugar transport system ATPase subunit
MAFLELSNVAKRFGRQEIIPPLDLAIEEGEFVVLVGPSGCGKSTIMRLIAGLELPDAGDIRIDGRTVTHVLPRDRDIAMVFQNYALYPDKTVYENMAFGLKMRKTPKPEIERRVAVAAAVLGLGDYMDRRPAQLSGGQRQRVAVGRAMVREPKVFLFDEPLSNLDAHLRVHMRTELVKLHRQLRATMVYVTHDQVEAMTMGDRIVVLDRGRIRQAGAPLELFRRPANTFVAGFIGAPAMNMLAGRLAEDGSRLQAGAAALPVPPAARAALAGHAGREVLFGIRPQYVTLAQGGGGTEGSVRVRIEALERLGTETVVVGMADGRPFQAVVPTADGAGPAIEPGSEIPVFLPMEKGHFFDPGSGGTLVHGDGAGPRALEVAA